MEPAHVVDGTTELAAAANPLANNNSRLRTVAIYLLAEKTIGMRAEIITISVAEGSPRSGSTADCSISIESPSRRASCQPTPMFSDTG
jgi:hypothetical protein